MKEASYYERRNGAVRCILCPHYCVINEGEKGICGVRENRGGKLYATTYCKVAAIAVDPIEKKPLYHFHPGKDILSVGSIGCNFSCSFCQNWHLVEGAAQLREVNIEELLLLAMQTRSVGISYTYNEPLIQWEFVYDCSRKFHEKNLKNVLVTNGFVNPDPLSELLPYVDGMNIDLKFSKEERYRKISSGRLEPVKKTIEMASKKCHVEVTTLMITGLNDSEEEIDEIVDFLSSINPAIPFHISRYFPNYRYNAPATDPAILTRAYDMARSKLHYVFLGNIHAPGASDSRCSGCGSLLVKRSVYHATICNLDGNICKNCGEGQNFVI